MVDIQIIHPAGPYDTDLLEQNCGEMQEWAEVAMPSIPSLDDLWPFTLGTSLERASQLQGLLEKPWNLYLAARGGYGCQELLPHLNWEKLSRLRYKRILGFSDVTALHCAVWSKLGWQSIHMCMPATAQWGENEEFSTNFLKNLISRKSQDIAIKLTQLQGTGRGLTGPTVGGCLSVLSNLIGTPYLDLPKDSILYLEDVNEHPARIARYFDQWLQSGAIQNCQALILGTFTQCRAGQKVFASEAIWEQLCRKTVLPVYGTELFGHGRRNIPLGFGYLGNIRNNQLVWSTGEPYEK